MKYISSSDGAKIAVYDLNPTGIQTIVLVHGWPLSHKMFEYQIPALLKENFRVITFDLRGFGNSDETATGYSYDQFATDLYYVIYTLNLSNFVLLGFSMGGAIAVRYMHLFTGYGVCKLCLLDAAVPSYCKTIHNPYGQTIEDTNELIHKGFQDRPSLNEYFGSIFFAQEHSKPFMNWLQRISDDASSLGEMQSLLSLRDEDCFYDLPYIQVPTGIFHGKEDKICPFEMTEIMHQNINCSKLFPLEQAGYGAFYDDKNEFNRLLLKFLGGYCYF